MTPNEAKELVEQCGLNIEEPKHAECKKIVIAALNKQLSKKPTHEATLYRCLTCPTCKNVIDEFTEFIPNQPKIRVKTLHCKFCGQKLDWGDT